MNREVSEILRYLNGRSDYCIFAGFASYLHTGVKASNDVDVYVASKKRLRQIAKDFIKNGWKIKKERQNKFYEFKRLIKNDTTVDLLYSVIGKKCFLLNNKTKIKFQKYNLNVLNKEALFLSKLQVIMEPDRKESKHKRDRKVLNILRKDLDITKLRTLMKKLPRGFWRDGDY